MFTDLCVLLYSRLLHLLIILAYTKDTQVVMLMQSLWSVCSRWSLAMNS